MSTRGWYEIYVVDGSRSRMELARVARWAALPREERPDYQLGFQVGLESVRQRVDTADHPDPVINHAHFSIAVGRLVHTWQTVHHQRTFLRWLHRITTVTDERSLGYLAGDYAKHWDISYVYRFFVHVPRLDSPQPVDGLTLQICDFDGNDLADGRALESEPQDEPLEDWELEDARELAELFSKLEPRHTRLDELRRTHDLVAGPFWQGQVPRGRYIGP